MKITPYIVGDVHFGRKFVNGVPLHRRGAREEMVMADFKNKLAMCDSSLFVQTGDLFNTFAVEEALVLEVYEAVKEEAQKNPNRDYLFYRGNHDASRDTNKKSSFDIFRELLRFEPNVYVLVDPYILRKDTTAIGFIPWHPFKSSTELAHELLVMCKDLGPLDSVFGHWDVESFGGKDENLVPTNVLCQITQTIYTGHIHKPTVFERDGVTVNVVGSMQPYSHSEDAGTDWYQTYTLAEFLAADSATFCYKNIRVLIDENEVVPEVDCLSLITKRVSDVESDEENDMEVSVADFNMETLFKDSLATRLVSPDVMTQIMTKFEELRNA